MILDSFKYALNAFENILLSYGYRLDSAHNFRYGYIIEYHKLNKRLVFTFDYKENTFYYYLVYGLDTSYPSDANDSNVVLFDRLFLKYIPNVDLSNYQPKDENYEIAINSIAKFLEKY